MTQAEQYLQNRENDQDCGPLPVKRIFNRSRGFDVFADGSVYSEDVGIAHSAQEILESRKDCEPASEYSDGLDLELVAAVEQIVAA
jgi:hypothetical protein